MLHDVFVSKIRKIYFRAEELKKRDCNMLCMRYLLPQIIDLSPHTHNNILQNNLWVYSMKSQTENEQEVFFFLSLSFACFPHSLTHLLTVHNENIFFHSHENSRFFLKWILTLYMLYVCWIIKTRNSKLFPQAEKEGEEGNNFYTCQWL